MIRKQFPDDRWCGCCPNCCSFDHQFVSGHSELCANVYEYECNCCGAHWEVEYRKNLALVEVGNSDKALMDAKLAGK